MAFLYSVCSLAYRIEVETECPHRFRACKFRHVALQSAPVWVAVHNFSLAPFSCAGYQTTCGKRAHRLANWQLPISFVCSEMAVRARISVPQGWLPRNFGGFDMSRIADQLATIIH